MFSMVKREEIPWEYLTSAVSWNERKKYEVKRFDYSRGNVLLNQKNPCQNEKKNCCDSWKKYDSLENWYLFANFKKSLLFWKRIR